MIARVARGVFAAALLLGLAGLARADTLTTRSFVVQIQVNCAEGEVVCDDVTYRGKSRRSGKSLELKGKTLHSLCADGVTPCRFLGYEFMNGAFRYRVFDSGSLRVTRGDKLVVDEPGEWQR